MDTYWIAGALASTNARLTNTSTATRKELERPVSSTSRRSLAQTQRQPSTVCLYMNIGSFAQTNMRSLPCLSQKKRGCFERQTCKSSNSTGRVFRATKLALAVYKQFQTTCSNVDIASAIDVFRSLGSPRNGMNTAGS